MNDGYFTAESAIRRIGNRSVLMLGGPRALLLQAAHPLVAAGIVDHSDFAAQPWKRLARTLSALYTIVFGTRAEADRAGAVVQAVHASVRGTLREDVGVFGAGTRYAASDAEPMVWVHATLVDTGIAMHEAYIGPLDRDEREAFYRDMQVVARVFGVPATALPRTLVDFEKLRRELLGEGRLAVGADARAVAATVLDPAAPAPLRPGLRALARAGVALLPRDVAELYGFDRDVRDAFLAVGRRSLRGLAVTRALPPVWWAGRRGLPLRLLDVLA